MACTNRVISCTGPHWGEAPWRAIKAREGRDFLGEGVENIFEFDCKMLCLECESVELEDRLDGNQPVRAGGFKDALR